ncbi:AMP-binding protein [Desulfuromonas sp. KJ2020]|uniref:AMP-dependent synthetase/ligase n=1 Tax=Desulfuromonas sp. KJ2020 TaxID=2919173 RepID=UPI0020A7FA8F|nr:AMP-binding protein [Desulfuromonas sp. KJ2020]MCP3176705.1 AMP-binding protein [Desulfuromonas sp. KJ2020]
MITTSPTTLFDVLIQSYRQFPQRTAFIYRAAGEEFAVTYEKLFDDVLLLARAFGEKKIGHGSKVMLLSDNRYGWMVTDLALISLGAISVPRGSDTPTRELEFIMSHADCEFLVVENEELYEQHREMTDKLPQLKVTFIIESESRHKLFQPIYAYQDLLQDRTITPEELQEFILSSAQRRPEDTVTLVYTSGTTGMPKGVVLTHRNLMHQIASLPPIIALTEEDRWLSILPSWHIFERTAEYIALAAGSCIVYSTLKTFADDLITYQPTLVATVPRLWESLYSKINAALEKQSKKKAKLFRSLVWISATFRRNSRLLKDHLPRYEKVFFLRRWLQKLRALGVVVLLFPLYLLARKKLALVQEKFGGRLRVAISGGGSLPDYLDAWLDAVGIRIANAYGMTECAPGIAGRALDCPIFGTLGKPIAGTEVRIVDEHGQVLPAGCEGEVQVRGQQVTPGYYNNPEENEKSFTADGFFKTGDLGKFTLTGELVLCGRSKEIIVLASGENIDPTHIEATITMLPFVADAVLVGQDKKGLGALIVPDMDKLKEYVTDKFSHLVGETEDFLNDKQVMAKVKNEINKLLHPKKGFKPYERLSGIRFLDKEFKAGEELTNTLKKKRHVIEQKYKEIINKLLK